MSDQNATISPGAPTPHQEVMPPDANASGAPSSPAPGAFSDGLVAAPEFFGNDQQIAPEYARGYEYMAQVFAGTGVRPAIANHGLDVIDQMMDMESLPEQKAAHSYDVARYRNDFKAEDQAPLAYFLNQMHAKGATQAEVNSFLTLYVDTQRTRAKRAALNAGKSELQRKPANEMGLEEIRQVMRQDRRRYVRDEQMQQRYRELLRARMNRGG